MQCRIGKRNVNTKDENEQENHVYKVFYEVSEKKKGDRESANKREKEGCWTSGAGSFFLRTTAITGDHIK